MIIRKARIKDCSACYELCRTPELTSPLGEAPPTEWIKSFVKEKQIFFVAEDNGKIVGFTMGEKITGTGSIFHLTSVKKEYQNQGIATKLIEVREKECKKRGVKYILCYTYAKSKKINNMMDKRGYKRGNLCYERLKKI